MPNSAISFNTAGLASATSPGLVGTGAQTFAGKKTLDGGALIKGDTSGNAITTGYVGEYYNPTVLSGANLTINTTEADITGATVTLSAGVWALFAAVNYEGASVALGVTLYIRESTNLIKEIYSGSIAVGTSAATSGMIIVNFTGANKTYRLTAKTSAGQIVAQGFSRPSFMAVRIA